MDETSWLIAREIPRLRRYALTLVNEPEAVDDLVQDTLERTIRKRGQWRRRGVIRSWLYRILYDVFINKCAADAKHNGDVELEDAPQLWSRPRQEDEAYCRDIAEAMQRLPHDQRAAIALTAASSDGRPSTAVSAIAVSKENGTQIAHWSQGPLAFAVQSEGGGSELAALARDIRATIGRESPLRHREPRPPELQLAPSKVEVRADAISPQTPDGVEQPATHTTIGSDTVIE